MHCYQPEHTQRQERKERSTSVTRERKRGGERKRGKADVADTVARVGRLNGLLAADL